jgi:hypothetical protein
LPGVEGKGNEELFIGFGVSVLRETKLDYSGKYTQEEYFIPQ